MPIDIALWVLPSCYFSSKFVSQKISCHLARYV
jgi:hypothetical protein